MSSSNLRQDILQFASASPIGIELGVAEGVFSELVLKNHDVSHWYSIDMWAGDRGHDISQYKRAIKRLMPYKDKNTIYKLKFDQALDLFPDEYFDIIYIDGYAHTGQDNGKTLHDWWPKLKPGGVFSGDDYCPEQWPLTFKMVNEFCELKNKTPIVYKFRNVDNNQWCRFPSWYIIK